ncbi:MAG: hypothetical protein NTV00_15740 [Methylococcales bacterium]|nr:hypothetical protein [Methylococcales bacterium]
MHEHLKSVSAFHVALAFPHTAPDSNRRLSDMEIVNYQALLMEAGADVLTAIKAGEMVEILAGLVNLAYVALAAVARQGAEVIDKPVAWQQDGYVLSVMKIISDNINHCTSGHSDNYSAVYCLCIHLTRGFVNADFDKAFQMIHANTISRVTTSGESLYSDAEHFRQLKLQKTPDLSECLYE